jgi:hypothetical protein
VLPFGLVLWVCVSMALSATVPAHSGLSRPPPVTCHLPACCRLRGTAHTLGYAKLSSGACPPFPLVSTAVGLWGTHAGRPHVRAGEIVVHGDAFYLACAAVHGTALGRIVFDRLRASSGRYRTRWLFRSSSSRLLLVLFEFCFGDPATVTDSPGLDGGGMAVLPFPGMVIDPCPRHAILGSFTAVAIHPSSFPLSHGSKASPHR